MHSVTTPACKTLSNMHMFTSQFTQHNKVYLALVKQSLYYTLNNTEYRVFKFQKPAVSWRFKVHFMIIMISLKAFHRTVSHSGT